MKNIWGSSNKAEQSAILESATKRARSESDGWLQRLERLRGSSLGRQEAVARLRAMSTAQILVVLDPLVWSPWKDDMRAEYFDAQWAKSPFQRWIDEHFPRFDRGAEQFALSTIECRNRMKTTTLFWEMVGLHPDEGMIRGLYFAWYLFVGWKTYSELAFRALSVGEARKARLCSTIAKDSREATVNLLHSLD